RFGSGLCSGFSGCYGCRGRNGWKKVKGSRKKAEALIAMVSVIENFLTVGRDCGNSQTGFFVKYLYVYLIH
ncbi:hypothetical protein QT972_19550, partial [Microcoleus sp. herbarium7]|uniref:hypothetical protein n=1 Tax=Microcoleus sp. herbarium7 TaxID=3055435 RepID=UPI002FD59EFF